MNMFQMKEQEKISPEKYPSKTEINNLHDKEIKAIRMLTELGKRIDEHSENFNKELEYIKKEPVRSKEDNYWNEKYTRGINRRLGDTELHISDLEDRIMEITQSEQQKEKQI